MAKRAATTELNHENWDEESKPEEPGVFTRASEDIIEKRVVKTAKRRLPRESSAKAVFSGLSAFKATPSTNASPFSFLSNVGSNAASTPLKAPTSPIKSPTTNGASKNTENGTCKKDEPSDTAAVPNTSTSKSEREDEKEAKKPTEYFAKLKGLNESVTQWIKSHVDSNPFCILTPIFKDYEKYLKDIEAKHGDEIEKTTDTSEQAQTTSSSESSKDTTVPEKKSEALSSDNTKVKPFSGSEWKPEKSIFGNINTNIKSIFGKSEQTIETPKSVFGNVDFKEVPKSIFGNVDKTGKSMFGNVSTEKNPFLEPPAKLNASDSKPEEDKKTEMKSTVSSFGTPQSSASIFSFGQSPTTTSASAGFSFGSAKPFTFSVQAVKPVDSEEKGDDAKDDEDDEPPKPEFKAVTEEGAVYEQRCKVFVKKDGNFSDRGVGILFLKPTPNGKTQLIVRAETSLGNLILNTLLTESIPVKRMNKNTIMLVCLPKPDSLPPPVPVLLRVKTDEDADKLLENLNKHKE